MKAGALSLTSHTRTIMLCSVFTLGVPVSLTVMVMYLALSSPCSGTLILAIPKALPPARLFPAGLQTSRVVCRPLRWKRPRARARTIREPEGRSERSAGLGSDSPGRAGRGWSQQLHR